MDFEYYLPLTMFATLGILLFSGYPVAFVLGGVGLAYGFVGYFFGLFALIEFHNIVPRIWGGVAENLILTAVPMFIFMGTALERSGVASDLLHCLQVLLRRVPGALALSVTVMGTILAATTGIIGASVVMMTLLALPVMLEQRYQKELATGTIAASGTLGILIPPSIMLVIMADLLAISVGTMFVAALIPGLMLSAFYFIYIFLYSRSKPHHAPPLADNIGPASLGGLITLSVRSFVPPVLLIILVLGSILLGWATPTEAAGVGAIGALLLAIANRRLSIATLTDIVQSTALTGSMLLFIFMGATAFSYVFRSLGGDDVITDIVQELAWGSWGTLIVLMVIVFVLGFFFDWVEITLIVIPIFAPIIELLDFSGHVTQTDQIYWFAILVAVNLQTSFLTPPFGFALFYMKGVAPPNVKIEHIYRGIIPFVILQLTCLGLIMAFPKIVMWLPKMLLG